jgi:2-keto-4-pentenoate hydratase
MDTIYEQDLVDLLVGLRRDGKQQSGLASELVPPDSTVAYRIAKQVADELGKPVGGWKVAATNATMRAALRSPLPIYGRVFADDIQRSPLTVVHASLSSPIPEVEYQVRLGADLPARTKPYVEEEVAAAVASIHPGIELAECRFVHDANFPLLSAILADGSGAARLVYGPAIDDWETRNIAGQPVTLKCNGVVVREGNAAQAVGHPIVSLTWLANELSQTGVGLRTGDLVSTGTLTGMLRPRAGDNFTADFGEFGSVSVDTV